MMTASGVKSFISSAASQAGETIHGGTIRINGVPYKVAVVETRSGMQLEGGGYTQTRTLDIQARNAVVPLNLLVDTTKASKPIKPQIVTFSGINYKITNVLTDPTGDSHNITAEEVYPRSA